MPLLHSLLTLFGLSLFGCQSAVPDQSAADRISLPAATTEVSPTPFALIELFTSQGCSSCPPADALLADLLEEYADQNVIGLSFHVDYWNRLGWADPYSQAAFSMRQRNYARHLDGRVYTPQMVVNGQAGFVGSRRAEAIATIERALERTPTTSFDLEVQINQEGTAEVNYRATDLPDGSLVHLALAESMRSNNVPRGENRGRTLQHINVVHDLQTLSGKSSGTTTFDLRTLEKDQAGQIVIFAQDPSSWAITGARMLEVVW